VRQGHRAASGCAFDQAVGDEPLERLAHGDPGDTERAHRMKISRRAGRNAAFGELLAQHQVDLAVLGQRQRLDHRGAVRIASIVLAIGQMRDKCGAMVQTGVPASRTGETRVPVSLPQ